MTGPEEGRGGDPAPTDGGLCYLCCVAGNLMPLVVDAPRSTLSQRLIAAAIILGFLYLAGSLVMTIVVSLLLALTLDPAVHLLTRRGIPRSLGALLMVLLLLAATYLFFYFFYAQAQGFAADFPKYSGTLRSHVLRVRQRAAEFQKQTEHVFSPESETPSQPGAPSSSWSSYLGTGLRSVTEILVLVSFIPFLVYFFLAWKSHLRRSMITMFSGENRLAAERTLDGITGMIRGFVVGNVIIGILLSIASGLFFWRMHLPYALFLGPMSGFLSLVPYFGVVLALLPPLLTGLVHFTAIAPLVAVILGVVALHLVALNVLYPKIIGRRVHLNPVVVTLALMFWGWLWGGLGLILAVPITAAMKAVCDNVISLRPYGRLMGD